VQLLASVKSTDARNDPVSALDIDRPIETSVRTKSKNLGSIDRTTSQLGDPE
jgi:hypothetical protein